MTRPFAVRLLACSMLLTWNAACAQLGRQADDPDEAGAAAQEDEAAKADGSDSAKAARKKKEKLRDKTREVEKKERSLHVAQLELKVARQTADAEAAAHEFSVAEAARELEEAERQLAVFGEIERPMKEAERELSVDRAERRLHEAKTDLDGILAIYEEEPEAMARDEIIRRHRLDVEFAELGLAIQRQKASLALENEDRSRERELNAAVASARRELDKARAAKERDRVKSEIALMKCEHALVDLEEELEDLRPELRKLKKAASE